MLFTALATDYDGTLATDGAVSEDVVLALRRFRARGRRLLLVTGRELPDLRRVFPPIEVFDLVVAENGALLYDPARAEETPLAPPPPAEFVDRIQRLNLPDVSIGRVVVAARQPHEWDIQNVIDELHLDWRISLNKGSIMALPNGVDKGSGLRAVLPRFGLSLQEVAGVGDAENDLPFLSLCGMSAAVSNALPEVKQQVHVSLREHHGAGVAELIEALLSDPVLTSPPSP